MAKNHICNCGKKLSSYHSLWRHRKICKKNQEPTPVYQPRDQVKIVGDILNKVTQRANMNVEPMTVPPKKPQNATVNAPKTSDIEMTDSETYSDPESEKNELSDPESSEENESTDPETDFMPDNPEDLKKDFRKLFKKLHYNMDQNIDIYNKLVFMLDELERMNCLTEEECNAMHKCLREKMGI